MSDTQAGAPLGGLRPVSYSELDCFRQCPMKWQLAYAEGWKPETTKEPLRLGSLWHEVMEAHYTMIKEWQEKASQTGKSPARATAEETTLLELCAGEVGHRVFDKLEPEDRELMEWAYAGYVEMHGCDPAWRILAVEIRGEVPLGDGERPIVFIIDLVVEDLDYGGVWIVDHKFPGDLASDTEIELDDQLGLYWYCWSIFGTDDLVKRVNGAMLNESRKKRNVGDLVPVPLFANGKPRGKPQTLEQRFRRTRTQRTAEELWAIAKDAEKVVLAMGLLAEHGALYSSPNPKQCGWKCDYKEVHIFSRATALPIAEVLSDFDFTSRAQREAEDA